MRKFLRMLLAVLFCTTAMCTSDVFASTITSENAQKSNTETVQDSIQEVKSTVVNSNKGAYSDEEVYLTAQLVHHEAHNQSYNGKVAIAEVVLNRVRSGLFPNAITEVINQRGQFINSRRLKNINPTDLEVRIAYNVLNGNLRVFNDTGVLYFRNPTVTSGISAKLDKDWGSLDYVTYIGDHAFYSQNIYNMQLTEEMNREKETKSLLAKFPTSSVISDFIKGKKNVVKKNTSVNEKAAETESIEASEEIAETSDLPVVVNEEAMAQATSQDTVITADGTELSENAAYMLAAHQALLAAQVLDESDDDDEIETEETVVVGASLMAAAVDPATVILNNDEAPELEVTSLEASDEIDALKLKKNEDEEEEIDENDPVAVAQRKARMDQKVSISQIAMLEQENAKANAAATEFAKQNVQAAVERANVLLKAGQTTITPAE